MSRSVDVKITYSEADEYDLKTARLERKSPDDDTVDLVINGKWLSFQLTDLAAAVRTMEALK